MAETPPETHVLDSLIAPHVGETGGLITALRAVQAAFGYLPQGADEAAARLFNLTRAEVKGVASFYSDFRHSPPGRTTIRLCAAEACQAQGARALEHAISRRFALKTGETSASGDLTLQHVYCLGLCSAGPAAIVGDRLIARATTEKLADAFAEGAR